MIKQGVCKHFKGIQHKQCAAGINIREVVGGNAVGWARRMPCFTEHETDVICRKFAEPTAKEIEDHEKDWLQIFESMREVAPIIAEMKRKYKKGGQDVTRCPKCGNILRIAIAGYNGHTTGKCDTENCLNWME